MLVMRNDTGAHVTNRRDLQIHVETLRRHRGAESGGKVLVVFTALTEDAGVATREGGRAPGRKTAGLDHAPVHQLFQDDVNSWLPQPGRARPSSPEARVADERLCDLAQPPPPPSASSANLGRGWRGRWAIFKARFPLPNCASSDSPKQPEAPAWVDSEPPHRKPQDPTRKEQFVP